MNVVVFCNVGPHDVVVSDGEDMQSLQARAKGKRILERVDAMADQLTFPVVQVVLDYVLSETNGAVDKIVFVGTDQPDEQFRQHDTLYYAQLATEVLVPRYGDQIRRADFRLVGSDPLIDPSMYDEAFNVYHDLLHAYESSDVTACYLLPTGGLPACNTALLIQGVHVFGERCRVVYQSGSGEPWPLQLGCQVMGVMREHTAIELLSRFEFGVAYNLIVHDTRVDRAALCLLQYADSRLCFDFITARSHLEDAISQSSGQTRPKLQAIRSDLEKLLASEQLARIGELYHSARIAWDNGRFVAFLGRLIRFQAAVLRYLANRLFETGKERLQDTFSGLAIQPNLRHFVLDTIEYFAASAQPRLDISQDTELLRQLHHNLDEYFDLSELQGLCFDLGVDYENLPGVTKQDKARELIGYSQRHGLLAELIATCRDRRPHAPGWEEQDLAPPEKQNLRTVCDALVRIDRLVPLRNASIIGHGYRGVSKEIILQEYNPDGQDQIFSPVEDMAAICSGLGISIVNPFRDIRDLVISQLR
jgi:hypothetical protein